MASGTTRFPIEAKIATGGMGVIYKARDPRTGELVALKLLHDADPQTLQRFVREAEVLTQLDHPAIVRYVAHGTGDDGAPFLAMQWIEGETLQARIEREGLTIVESVRLVRRLAEGLRHAHARGIVHRDMKPGNVLLPGGALDQATIVDFGIARTDGAPRSLTATGTLVGTPAYMAPEQARGERTIDARVDVFALGCVLYECLSGRKAFEGKHALALIAKVVLWAPVPVSALVPEVPPELDALVQRMIAKHPGERPDTDALIAELAALNLDGITSAARSRGATLATAAAATAQIVARPRATIVIATSAEGADGGSIALAPEALEERRRTVGAALGGREVRAEILHDGSVLVLAPSTMSAAFAAAFALDCARALAAALPELLIAITTGEVDQPASGRDVFDLTVGSLAKEAIVRMFALEGAAPPPGAIRVDAATAQLLAGAPIVHIAGVAYVT